ncbi:baseplate J/gp47 family protein [Victivallis sp. Marseille-Q1083]|uniref:baseplate J/gp47 family protein n=1 Tax=Victivallis sp. Marseille-Q1083 TaxID=2717288 RepID=UPI00158E9F21|nr:baseplate J/gp47 family protein [Victivallis sp. Marseille-Q1083]
MIDRSKLTPEQKIFFDGVIAAGFPADDAAFESDMRQLADAAHLPIANPSKYSAFWCFVRSAVAAPARELARYLVTAAVPGFYVKTATGAALDLHAWLHGLTRKPAVKMTGKITFSRAAGAVGPVEIPAGTRVRTIAVNGTIYRVATTAAAVIAEDAETAVVPVEAEAAGSGYNLGAGYYSILDSDVPRLGAVTNAADYLAQPGADEETDGELRLRIRDRFLSVGDWHTDAKYRAMISERAGVRPDRVYFDHSAPRGPGSADCFIIFDAGTVPTDYLADLNDYIAARGNHGHGDDLQCKTIPVTYYELTATVRLDTALDAAAAAAAKTEIQQRIKCAFWDNSNFTMTHCWPFSTFSFSRLASELHAAVPGLLSIQFNRGDIASALELPKLSSVTVTEAE